MWQVFPGCITYIDEFSWDSNTRILGYWDAYVFLEDFCSVSNMKNNDKKKSALNNS